MNIHNFDLRLLSVFDAVFTERSMSRAALRLGVTQPAVSNAIRRLRHQIKDELFLRTAEGLVPTSRALCMAVPIQQALRELHRAIMPAEFVPETCEHTFKFAISSNTAPLLLSPLYSELRARAPAARIKVRPKRSAMLQEQLDSGEVDCAIGVSPALPGRFDRAALFTDRLVCAMRADHRLAGRKLTRRDYISASHISVDQPGDGSGYLDRSLECHGVQRMTSVSINHILLAPEMLQRTDLLLTGFRRVIESHPAFREFHVVDFPFKVEPITVSLIWHRACDTDPAHAWFRGLVADVARRACLATGAEPAPMATGRRRL